MGALLEDEEDEAYDQAEYPQGGAEGDEGDEYDEEQQEGDDYQDDEEDEADELGQEAGEPWANTITFLKSGTRCNMNHPCCSDGQQSSWQEVLPCSSVMLQLKFVLHLVLRVCRLIFAGFLGACRL